MSEINNEKEVLLTEEQVNYVLTFAESLMGGYSPYGNAMTPMMLNQRMKDVTLNPLQATENTLTQALNNPKGSELQLQAFSQDFEIQSQVYKKLLSYLGTMLSFDMTYTCINSKSGDYAGKAYQKDLDVLKRFVDKFDYKQEFTTIVQEMIRNEAYFGCPRFEGDQMVIQELPASPTYTMITGRWDYGLLYSLNMYWFVQPGVDLDLYPAFFKKKYAELWINGQGLQRYQPSLSPTNRGDSLWVYWQDIPVDVGWCFKLSPAIAARVPYYSGLFLDLIQQPQMRALQKNINMAAAARIVIGEIPLLNKTTQAGVRDQFSISAKNLGEFLGLVKSAIGDSIKTAAVPLTNVQGISFPVENTLYSSYLKTALATSGVNTNLIFTSDVRPNSIESQLSLNVDENQLLVLYPQFEKFINYHVNKMTKNFKFKVEFEGTNFFNNRQQRFDKYTSLASTGIVLPQKIAASIGMNPFDFQRQLEEAQETGWVDKLTPIVSGFQQSAGGASSGAGRPQKKDGDLSDSGESTRTSGTNIEKGGKI